MISVLSLVLGVALIGLACTIFGVLLSLLMGLLGLTTKKLTFVDSMEASIESIKPAFIAAAILVVPGCYALLEPSSDIPAFLYYPNRFGSNNDIISGLLLFLYIFVPIFLVLYWVNIKQRLR
jgi:hypothetical protein